MTVFSETTRTARTPKHCSGCCTKVNPGERYVRWVGVTDGDFGVADYHVECREAEIALNKVWETLAGEWMGLQDHEAEDIPWLIAEHPVAAARLGIDDRRP